MPAFMFTRSSRSSTLAPPFTEGTQLIDILELHAAARPSQVAYRFLDSKGTEIASLDYAALEQRVHAIGSSLVAQGWQGQRALLLYPPGLEFIEAFLGCLWAGVLAVPAYPPKSTRHLGRLRAIIDDAEPAIALTCTHLQSRIERQRQGLSTLQELPLVSTDTLYQEMLASRPQLDLDDLAFLQYTSGSTAAPKGVRVSHGNLLDNEALIYKAHGHSPESVLVSWLPTYHDMGLIGQVLQSLYAGAHCILMAPATFLRRPRLWLETISRFRGTTSGGPNFAYDLCVQRIGTQELQGLDLSSWQVAFNGAEPVRASTLEGFAHHFAASGFQRHAFFPCYGLAEATLFVAGGDSLHPPVVRHFQTPSLERGRATLALSDSTTPSRALVSCGPVREGFEVQIVDPDLSHPLPDSFVGEVWLRGPSVAQGYWQAGADDFSGRIAGGADMLRTGDLGFLYEGELYLTSRIKDLIILRGRNLHPQDIELTTERVHPALRSGGGAAFSIEPQADAASNQCAERLILVHELESQGRPEAPRIVELIREAIFQEHEFQPAAVVLIRTQTLPRTSSGKVQRRGCRQAYLDGTLHVLHAWSSETAQPREQTRVEIPKTLDQGERLSASAATAARANADTTPGTPVMPAREPAKDIDTSTSASRADAAITWLRSYSRQRLDSRLMDERRSIPPSVVLDFGNNGLLGLLAQRRHGGLGLRLPDALRVFEQLAAIDLSLATFVSAHNGLGLRTLLQHGSESLRRRLVPRLASGRELGSLALTEDNAGSNPRVLETSALQTGEGRWRLHGKKIWSGSVAWAGVIHVFARHRGGPLDGRISAFALPRDLSGVRLGPEALTFGARAMLQGTVYLDDVEVGAEHLLGDAGMGMEVAHETFQFARLGIGALSLGGLKRCLQLMLRYARRRTISTGLLLENPVTLERLRGHAAASEALENLVTWTAEQAESTGSIPMAPAVTCKLLGSEFVWQAADDLVQLLGGRGYMEPNLAPQILRDSRLFRIFEGPSETLASFLGASFSSRPQDLRSLLTERLDATELEQQLREAQETAQARLGTSPNSAARQLYQYRLGLAVSWTVLAAVARSGARLPLARVSERWLHSRVEAALADLLRFPSEDTESALTVAQLRELSDQLDAGIGNVDQSYPGEDREIDPLLQGDNEHRSCSRLPQPTEASRVAASPLSTDTAAAAGNPGGTSLETWLLRWLQTNTEDDGASLGPDVTFSHYGIDSVSAVLLVGDLEDYLQRELSPDLLWTYPTVRSLAAHLENN